MTLQPLKSLDNCLKATMHAQRLQYMPECYDTCLKTIIHPRKLRYLLEGYNTYLVGQI